MSTRDKLDYLHQKMLGEIDGLEARLEAVAGQVAGSVTQLQADRAAAKVDMNAIADKLVSVAEALKEQRSRYGNLVNLSPEGKGSVATVVDGVLNDEWQQKLAKVINGAEKSTALAAISDLKAVVEQSAARQTELLQQQAQQGFDWPRLGAFVAACVASAVISGGVVAWIVKPAAPAVRQDLTLESGIPAAKSGEKIDAAKQQR